MAEVHQSYLLPELFDRMVGLVGTLDASLVSGQVYREHLWRTSRPEAAAAAAAAAAATAAGGAASICDAEKSLTSQVRIQILCDLYTAGAFDRRPGWHHS